MPKIEDYIPIVGQDTIDELYSLADEFQGKTVQNINSTFMGGGVAEMLSRMIPFYRQLEIDVGWDIIKGNEKFFRVTKKIHNDLQGFHAGLNDEDLSYFLEINKTNAETIDLYGDIISIHDPQPIALVNERESNGTKWIWRCHIDLTEPQPEILNFLRNYIEKYDCAVFSMQKYLQSNLNIKQLVIYPSIDPLSNKNKDINDTTITSIVDRFGIDSDRPIVTQISRFDTLKNPIGAIDIYKKVKRDIDCQLVLAGGDASDDPESSDLLEKVKYLAKGDSDIHVIFLPPSSDLEINALQRASTVILQNSLREGFGLTVTEALWKAKPVIASSVGGIPLQITHKISGLLSTCFDETVDNLRKLLLEPEYALRLGMNGRKYVRNNFLITRHVKDCLLTFRSLYN
ncbi:MAG: glycosyltransferase [Methanotrichaceae archaeon]|nr:glycosyltransferase [Methanotrichaceae archaeon]